MSHLVARNSVARHGLARYGLLLSGWVAVAATLLPAELTPLRAVLVVPFVLVCPGAAALRLTHPDHRGQGPDRLEFAVLSVAFSVVIDTLVAEAFFFTHSITTLRAVGALAVMTSLMALYPLRRRERRSGP